MMLLTIILSITLLVSINFLLLKFSINKTQKSETINKKPVVLKTEKQITAEKPLKATGS